MFYSNGSSTTELSGCQLKQSLETALEALGKRHKVLAIPPDFTRFHSQAGELTRFAWQYYGSRLTDILPALGTHVPMTGDEISAMFGDLPRNLFRVHDWRKDLTTLGEIPAELVREQSEGALDYSWQVQVNKLLAEGGHDLILSIGQVVPHEATGMSNYNKNIFVGVGGADGINKSHFLGAVYGMERFMGRADSPVRRTLDYASENFASHLPIVYVLTVIGRNEAGELVTRGLFVGDDRECFQKASELSLEVNFQMLEREITKAVVLLDPEEFKTTWVGNKAIYRTRMALADDAELIVLAPGVKGFGEDPTIGEMIRKYGYFGTPKTLEAVNNNADLKANLGAAAHLIHSSSEGRFRIIYCPGHLNKDEIEGVGFEYADLASMMERYNPAHLTDGYNNVGGEEIFYISKPALGLWACKERFHA